MQRSIAVFATKTDGSVESDLEEEAYQAKSFEYAVIPGRNSHNINILKVIKAFMSARRGCKKESDRVEGGEPLLQCIPHASGANPIHG